jgi:hypothetical protein
MMKPMLKSGFLATVLLLPSLATADSFRCGRKLVKTNESANALIKKCGQPVRKYSSKTEAWIEGSRKRVSVSNWVYERRGKRDMIISVHQGNIIKLSVD